jgi:hypothetical protein
MSLTAANAVIMLTIPGVFNSPQQLQQFAADDVFATDAVASAEVAMGVDGFLTGGFVFNPIAQGFTLQADSPSNQVFDDWFGAQVAAKENLIANGLIVLPAVARKWTMIRGFLTSYAPMPDGGRVLKQRRFGVTWQSASPSPA